MKRISTGNPKLDSILKGGFPADSMNIIMGLPGTGKTILAQQLIFHNATAERPALYFSTASEPLDKMLGYVQEFEFFDIAKIGEAIIYQDLNTILRTDGLAAAVSAIVDGIKEQQPALLVIDSFKALHSFASSEREFRVQLSVLTAALSSLAITSFLVGEYAEEDVAALAEFAVADSVISLILKPSGMQDSRHLRVTKLRGSDFFGGEHAFRIGPSGLNIFPRLATPTSPISYELSQSRALTGVAALDSMLAEGFWAGSSTVVFGPPGSGKTLLGLHFVFRGIEKGEKGIIATLQENPTQLARIVAGFGWDLQAAIDSGMLDLVYVSPIEVLIDEFVQDLISLAKRRGAVRVMIDSLNDLNASTDDTRRFRDYIYALTQITAVEGISLIMTQEVRDLFATTVLSEYGVSHMSDNVVLLTYVREESRIKRALAVIKTRASAHDPGIREFVITPGGINVGQPFEQLHIHERQLVAGDEGG